MDKKESSKAEDMKSQNPETRKINTSSNSKRKKDKPLPWWVELLFVQIGLPDKLLIKILKSNKQLKEFYISERRSIYTLLLLLGVLSYFYPVIKYSKAKLDCESFAKTYILKEKNLNKINNRKLKMLSTNFCNGGNEIQNLNK